MCQALKELIEDGRMEGRAEGRAEGRTEGHSLGLEEGRKEIILRMYTDGNIDVEMASMYLECTPEVFMEYVKAAKSTC